MAVVRFKSRETGDLVMLGPVAKRVLGIVGKDAEASGILLPDQIPAAIGALRRAIDEDEAQQRREDDEARARGEDPAPREGVSLRMRCAPFIEMLPRCERAQVEVVWGV